MSLQQINILDSWDDHVHNIEYTSPYKPTKKQTRSYFKKHFLILFPPEELPVGIVVVRRCSVQGRSLSTLDGLELKMDLCHHTLLERVTGAWVVQCRTALEYNLYFLLSLYPPFFFYIMYKFITTQITRCAAAMVATMNCIS